MARELPPGYSLHIGYPPVEAYLNLRVTSGLSPRSVPQAEAVYTGSWYGCYITYKKNEDDELPEFVAMGRIIGDGGWYFVIADMAVLPTHQKKGLGDYVLKNLIQKIRSTPPMSTVTAEGGPKPWVNLLADPPGRKLYEKNGFYYTAPGSLGMALKWD